MKTSFVEKARALRKSSTNAENKLWSRLRDRRLEKFKFKRQYPVGKFIVDFVCVDKKLIVEVDGGHHAGQAEKDEGRARWLESKEYKVIRFWNDEVLKKTDAVLEVILENLRKE